MSGTASSGRQAQRLRSICRAFFEECRSAEADAERGRSATTVPAGGSASGGGEGEAARSPSSPPAVQGVRCRLHECAGFVAVLTLLLQSAEEWAQSKRFVLVSSFFFFFCFVLFFGC